MTSKEKIEYMLHKVRERARISPAGFFYVDCAPIVDLDANGGIPDDAPEILSRADQVNILQKFQNDNLLFGVEFEKEYKGAWVAIMNLDIESEENPYNDRGVVKQKTGAMIETPVYGGTLALNTSTGYVRLNAVANNLNPKGKEFKVVHILMTSDNHIATYAEIVGREPKKIERRTIGFLVRNIKEKLGILPKKKAQNKDIFRIKRGHGYQLITEHT